MLKIPDVEDATSGLSFAERVAEFHIADPLHEGWISTVRRSGRSTLSCGTWGTKQYDICTNTQHCDYSDIQQMLYQNTCAILYIFVLDSQPISALLTAALHLHPPQVRCIPRAEARGFTAGLVIFCHAYLFQDETHDGTDSKHSVRCQSEFIQKEIFLNDSHHE